MGPQSRVSYYYILLPTIPGPKLKSCTSMVDWPDLSLRNPRFSLSRDSNQEPLDLEAVEYTPRPPSQE